MWFPVRFSFSLSFSLVVSLIVTNAEASSLSCEDLFSTIHHEQENPKGKPLAKLLIHAPIVGPKIKADILKQATLVSPKATTNPKTWNFWQIRLAADETVAVLKDRRLDPYLATWLERTPISRDSSREQLGRIEQLRQYTYLALSNNYSPDAPMRDGELARMIGAPTYDPQNMPPMRYFTLGDFLKINRGICRHSALALMVLLQADGFDAEYVTGEIRIDGKIAPHAWVTVKNSLGHRYLLDAAVYLDEVVRVPDGYEYAQAMTDAGHKQVEYQPYVHHWDGVMRPIDRGDDHIRFFKRK